MKLWLLLALILGCTSILGHAEQVEFQAVFVASPMPIQTGTVRFSPQPGLVTTLTPAAQKTLLTDLGKSTPVPDLLTLPGEIWALQKRSLLRPANELPAGASQPKLPFSAQVECEAQSITDSRIKVVLRPQAFIPIDEPTAEPVVITAPISSDATTPLPLPPAHTDQWRLQTLVNTELPSGDWALIYLGKIPSETDLPRYLYALIRAGIVK